MAWCCSLADGVLISAYGWSPVFFVNVLLAGISIVAAFFVIPKDAPRSEPRSFDLPGALTVTAGATLLVYALVLVPKDGLAGLAHRGGAGAGRDLPDRLVDGRAARLLPGGGRSGTPPVGVVDLLP